MAINEPPPVYSSLSEMDILHFRGEEAKKKSLFLSPFTARKEPKVLMIKRKKVNYKYCNFQKFAIFHIVASLILFGLGAVYGLTVMVSLLLITLVSINFMNNFALLVSIPTSFRARHFA